MSSPTDPSQAQTSFTRKMGIGGAVLGAAAGFIAGGVDGVVHGYGEYADIALACIGSLVGAFIGYGSAKAANQRGNELKTWCAAHGWIWIGSRPPWGRGVADFKSTMKHSKIFWHQGSWRDVLVRDEGKTPAIFAERVIRREHQPDRVASFLVIHYSGNCPDTTLESHHGSDWLPKMDGRHKVEFESIDFNQQWRVHSKDPKAAYDHIDQSTIEFLEQQDLKPAIELVDHLLIIRFEWNVHHDGAREKCLHWAESFSNAVPDDLLEPIRLLS